ncbi:MAG TPA: hypothetical protein VLD57_08370, partial [Blastocatellia bacterium]|nr:hypothetical protein [Blastocatellia bacterium]
LVKGAAEEDGFVQGHTRGNHVALVRANLAPGMHRVFVAHATPNRLYCEPAEGAVFRSPDALWRHQPERLYQLTSKI